MKNSYSIALCTCDGEKFLTEQIKSILEQTIIPSQIVICDDNSSDETIKIVRHFAKNNAAIKWRIIQNSSRLGVVKNFEQAIRQCSEEIIFLSDQDDVWRKNKAEIILNHFNNNTDDVVFTNAFLINENQEILQGDLFDVIHFSKKQKKHFKKNKFAMYMFLQKNYATGATMAFRKDFVEKCMPIPICDCIIHDYWFALIGSCIERLGVIDTPTIYYRQHKSQLIGLPDKNSVSVVKHKRHTLLTQIVSNNQRKEFFALSFFTKNANMISKNKLIILQKRQLLYSKLTNKSANSIQRTLNISFALLWFKIPEFNSLRLFIGNTFHYIFKV